MRLRKLIDLFLAWCEQARRPATAKNYRWLLNRFASNVGDPSIHNLKPLHLSSYARTWHEVQAVQRLFQWAMNDLEAIDRNVFSRVKRPPAGQRTRILSPRQLAGYLRQAKAAFRRFLLAMRETIARPQEIRLVTWEMLQSEIPHQPIEQALATGRAIFVLRDYKARDRRLDPSAPRILLVSRRLGRLLLRLVARLRAGGKVPTGPVFLNCLGQCWTANAVRCCMRRLRVKFPTPSSNPEHVVAYTIRHSLATIAAAAGVRDAILAAIMGHASTRTTARYQHLQVEHLRQAFELIELQRSKRR